MEVAICGPNLVKQDLGQFHVHRAGCADLRKYGKASMRGHNCWKNYGGGEPWVVEVSNVLDVITEVYDSMIAEQDDPNWWGGGQSKLAMSGRLTLTRSGFVASSWKNLHQLCDPN